MSFSVISVFQLYPFAWRERRLGFHTPIRASYALAVATSTFSGAMQIETPRKEALLLSDLPPRSGSSGHRMEFQSLFDAGQRLEIPVVVQESNGVLGRDAGDQTVMGATRRDALRAAGDVQLGRSCVSLDGMSRQKEGQTTEILAQFD